MRLNGGGAVLELPDGGHARKSVPDLDQTADRPIACDFHQFLLGVECGAAFGCLGRVADSHYLVLGGDEESLHALWFSFPLVAVRTYITLRGAVIKSILRTRHRKFKKLLGWQVFRFHGAEVEQMAAGADDELNAIAIELFQKPFVNGNYGAFGHAAC